MPERAALTLEGERESDDACERQRSGRMFDDHGSFYAAQREVETGPKDKIESPVLCDDRCARARTCQEEVPKAQNLR